MFSERYGYRSVRDTIQIDSLEEDTRARLWNLLDARFFKSLRERSSFEYVSKNCFKLIYILYDRYFKLSISILNDVTSNRTNPRSVFKKLENYIHSSDWFDVYDFIEKIIEFSKDIYYESSVASFIEDCNLLLEEELCGYRIISGFVTPIITHTEIAEIEEALLHPFDTVNQHLKTALELFSDRVTPNYPNSVKESVSAVEGICKIILSEKNITLGAALKSLENSGISIHGAFKRGLSNIYGWTSSDAGIRHARIDDSDIGSDEAKFMIVLCSAFINFLITKAERAGIDLMANYNAIKEN